MNILVCNTEAKRTTCKTFLMKTIIMQMLKYHTQKKKPPTEKQGKQLKIDLNELK